MERQMSSDQLLYVSLAIVVILAVNVKAHGRDAHVPTTAYVWGSLLGSFAAFVIGYVFERSSPFDIALLSPRADIYSVFLISVSYAILVRVGVRFLVSHAKGAVERNRP